MNIHGQPKIKECKPVDNQEDQLWISLLSELLRLSRLYQRRGDSRRVLRCEATLKALEMALARHGQARGLPISEILHSTRMASATAPLAPERIQEAMGWWNSHSASYLLASKLTLKGGDSDMAIRLGDVHRTIRAVIQCVYPDAPGADLIHRATRCTEDQEASFKEWALRHLPNETSVSHLREA